MAPWKGSLLQVDLNTAGSPLPLFSISREESSRVSTGLFRAVFVLKLLPQVQTWFLIPRWELRWSVERGITLLSSERPPTILERAFESGVDLASRTAGDSHTRAGDLRFHQIFVTRSSVIIILFKVGDRCIRLQLGVFTAYNRESWNGLDISGEYHSGRSRVLGNLRSSQ